MSLNAKTLNLFACPCIVICAALGGCATGNGKGPYIPPEALSPPSAKMSDALLAFTTLVQTETLANYRRAVREDMLRGAILDFMTGTQLDAAAWRKAMPSPKNALCLPRYTYLRIAAPVELTAAKAQAVKDLLKPPGTDVRELLAVTSTNFTIDVTASPKVAPYDDWMSTKTNACAAAVESADPFATRGDLTSESGAAAALMAFKTLFDTLWGVVKPAVVGTLQNINLERRNRAVQDFFANPQNTAALKSDIESIETFLGKEFALQSKRTAGVSVATLDALADFSASHWTIAMTAAKKGRCSAAMRDLYKPKPEPAAPDTPKSPLDPTGVGCLNNVYAALAAPLKAALDAGDAFDQTMDKELPQEKLSGQIDTLSALAQGKMDDDMRLRATWGVLVRYATLYDTVKATGSDANKKKVDDALNTLNKALK